MSKTSLIFGVGGMDGSHLADILLEKGHKVYGTLNSSIENCVNIKHLRQVIEKMVQNDIKLNSSHGN